MENDTLLRNMVRYMTRIDLHLLLYWFGGSRTVLGTPTAPPCPLKQLYK
jgi:hypothetical protein